MLIIFSNKLNSYYYNLLLNLWRDYNVKNLFELVSKLIRKHLEPNDILVSLDIFAMFLNIPSLETL